MSSSGRQHNDAQDTEIFGIFRGLDIPFASSDCLCPQFSPLYGLDKDLIKNLRVHGHYGNGWEEVFMQPDGHPQELKFARDATAALIRLLFPSSVGLVVNSGLRDKLNDILKPITIAKIFKLIVEPKFYTNQTSAKLLEVVVNPKHYSDPAKAEFLNESISQSTKDIFKALLPDHMKQKWENLTNDGKKRPFAFIPSQKTLPTIKYYLDLAKLLETAFKDNVGDKAEMNGYPRHVVERVLLCYMWEKYKHSKINFKPYYLELARVEHADDQNVITIFNETHIKNIVWEGPGSFYDKTDYENPGQITPLEKFFLKKLGYAHFEDRFPVTIEYGVSCKDGKKFYSDCGDSMLRNFFMMMLYNFETKKFDVSKLKALRTQYNEAYIPLDKLIDYFENICTSPVHAETAWARNKWIVVLNHLNDYRLPDDGRNIKVRYRSKDKTHEIDVGLDNIINVISKLLGPALFPPDDLGRNMNMKINWLSMLSTICQFFSNGYHGCSNENTWLARLSTTNHKHDIDECEDFTGDVPNYGWVDLTLTFSYGSPREGRKNIFECQIESNHFGFNRLYDHSEQDSLFSVNDDIADSVFRLRMNTSHEKINAIDAIFSTPFKVGEPNKYMYMVENWLDVDDSYRYKSGTFFANWHNCKVNSALANVLLKYMPVEEILNLGKPALNYALVFPLAHMGRIDDIKLVLADDLNSEEWEIEAFLHAIKGTIENPQLIQNKFSTASRALEETLLKGSNEDLVILYHAGANDYANTISGLSLLHLAAYAGNKRLTTSLSQLNIDINAKTHQGDTPLHFAVRSGSAKTVQVLLSVGANCRAINKAGETISRVASTSYSKKIGLFSYFAGCSSHMEFIECPYSKKGIDGDIQALIEVHKSQRINRK